ncbi:MAG: nucleotidyltransferase domain-containing protein [Thermoleophilia bacterium]|nr:nucleotidyltransferase domain-containing protein [Thermoleophilia bacterium]
MTSVLEERLDDIAKISRRHGVSTLAVFGSAAGGDFREGESDIDLLVEFVPMEPYERVEAYFALRDELERALEAAVDLVVSGAVKNSVIAREIERTKRVLYAA